MFDRLVRAHWERRALIGAFCIMAATFAARSAAAQTPAEIKARGKIIIGVMVDVPPFAILNADNQPDGYDADIAKLLAKRMGVPLQMVVVTGPNRIPYLLTGKVDMLVAVLGIVPERTKLVAFSTPYSGFSQFVWGPVGKKITGPADLKGLTIGVPRANTADIALSKIVPPGTNILRFDDDAAVRQALAARQIDVATASTTTIPLMNRLTGKGTYERKFDLNTQVEGVAVRPEATELLAWVNDAIKQWRSDGTIDKINAHWVGAPLPDLTVPPAQKSAAQKSAAQ